MKTSVINNFNIYRATVKDLPSLVSLRMELLKELGEIKTTEETDVLKKVTWNYLQEALANDQFISYLASKNDEVVSTSGMILFKRPPSLVNLKGIEAFILNMYTVPKFRGNGLASHLLECCINESKKFGVGRIWLYASQVGEPLYAKMGFV